MRLYQIPFSHNCVKVRRALDLKGVSYETYDIDPMDRRPVVEATGQALVPALVDGDHRVADSTAILLHLEAAHPERPLLPSGADLRAECLVLEDWADAAFMALTRRLAYWRVVSTPGAIERLFLAGAGPLKRWVGGRVARRAVSRRFRLSAARNREDEAEARRLARLAVDRLGDRPFLVGGALSIADLALASMSAPLAAADPGLREDPAVDRLLAWGDTILGPDMVKHYRP